VEYLLSIGYVIEGIDIAERNDTRRLVKESRKGSRSNWIPV
jgi:hypothetical protein